MLEQVRKTCRSKDLRALYLITGRLDDARFKELDSLTDTQYMQMVNSPKFGLAMDLLNARDRVKVLTDQAAAMGFMGL